MKNILGKTDNLKLFNKEGKLVYKFCKTKSIGIFTKLINQFTLFIKYSYGLSYEYTYDSNGKELTYKDSDGLSYEYTYDSNGKELTYKDSDGFSSEYTRDSNGNELTYKNSDGVTRGFNIPEYTMEQLVEKLGNFKIKKR